MKKHNKGKKRPQVVIYIKRHTIKDRERWDKSCKFVDERAEK